MSPFQNTTETWDQGSRVQEVRVQQGTSERGRPSWTARELTAGTAADSWTVSEAFGRTDATFRVRVLSLTNGTCECAADL